jgi:uncharacterized protein YbgA (DUF1722 family)/uncharacterized protein YbbK (DUF523 family)
MNYGVMPLREFPVPRIVSSRCLEFEACRYNGLIIRSSIVENLKKHVKFHPICPEVEIGLGVPRKPVRVSYLDGRISLLQPETGLNLTDKMNEFSESFLNSLADVDGFILKNKSPSCGIKGIKVYDGFGDSRIRGDGVGLFAASVRDKFPQLPVEDEGRLRNLMIRENFLTKIFTLADFRELRESGDFNDLIDFQTRNKLLLLSYSQKYVRKMGNILSNHSEHSLDDVKDNYGDMLLAALSEPQRVPSNINVLMHAFGYFSNNLKSPEKMFFMDSLQKYREGRLPLLAIINLLKSWIIRFDEEYLLKQTFFEPYPEDLIQVTFIFDRMA